MHKLDKLSIAIPSIEVSGHVLDDRTEKQISIHLKLIQLRVSDDGHSVGIAKVDVSVVKMSEYFRHFILTPSTCSKIFN